MSNGTFIADIAYELYDYSKKYRRIGAILYFRSHDCKVKVTQSPPLGKNIIGKFKESEKVPDAPMVEGDLFAGDRKVGHIHSQQNEYGDTLYWMNITEDVHVDMNGGKAVWLKVKLEDK